MADKIHGGRAPTLRYASTYSHIPSTGAVKAALSLGSLKYVGQKLISGWCLRVYATVAVVPTLVFFAVVKPVWVVAAGMQSGRRGIESALFFTDAARSKFALRGQE